MQVHVHVHAHEHVHIAVHVPVHVAMHVHVHDNTVAPSCVRTQLPGRHILESYTGNTRVFGDVVVYFLRKYTVYFPCNLRVPTEITRNTREIDTPQWRNDGEITLIC